MFLPSLAPVKKNFWIWWKLKMVESLKSKEGRFQFSQRKRGEGVTNVLGF